MQDIFCSTCAYRVNERVIIDASVAMQMTCLHPSVHREACNDARDERGACGPDAVKWSRNDGVVILRCPRCGKRNVTKQEKSDPPRTAEIHIICNECDNSDFSECTYFDAKGQQLYVA